MGMTDHVSAENFMSIMSNPSSSLDIQPIDRDGLTALYMLNTGDLVEDLGPWSDTSMNIRGDFVNGDDLHMVSFGVRSNNGVFTPWIDGPAPEESITHLRSLPGNPTGMVNWTGHLFGFTPAVEAVTGDAWLRINLGTLAGDLDFSKLEYWPTGQSPQGFRRTMERRRPCIWRKG